MASIAFAEVMLVAIGHTDFDVLPATEAQALRNNDTRVLQSGRAVNTLETVTDAKGGARVFTVLKFLLTNPAGHKHVAGVALDITERIHYREELEAANRRLESILTGKSALSRDDITQKKISRH